MSDEQPPPVPNNHPAVWDLVIEDAKTRDAVGVERYGTRLQPFNSRDALRDAYEESLDQTVYLRQALWERDNPNTKRQWMLATRAHMLTLGIDLCPEYLEDAFTHMVELLTHTEGKLY